MEIILALGAAVVLGVMAADAFGMTFGTLLNKSFEKLGLHPKDGKSTVNTTDNLIDQFGIVTKEIASDVMGRIILNGVHWSALSDDGEITIPVGSRVIVSKVKGTTLMVTTKAHNKVLQPTAGSGG